MLVAIVLGFPVERALAAVVRGIAQACALACGPAALDCIVAPATLAHVPDARTRRLMRQSRISCW